MEFNFFPLTKKHKIESESYVRLYKTGQVNFSRSTMATLGISLENPTVLAVYQDPEKRTIAFKVITKLETRSKNYRTLVPRKIGDTVLTSMSIGNFMKSIGAVKTPSERLQIKEYKDTFLGRLFYFKIPIN